MWWVKQKLRRENISLLPPALALRKEAEDSLSAAAQAKSEAEVRRMVGEINDKIRHANTRPLAGPPLNLVPFNVERIVEQWRTDHPRISPQGDAVTGPGDQQVTARRAPPPTSWWPWVAHRKTSPIDVMVMESA